MKKIISILLLLALSMSLCACGSDVEAAEPTVQPTAEPVEEALPDYEAMAHDAAALFFDGDYEQAYAALSELEDKGIEGVDRLLGLCRYYGYGCEIEAGDAVELLEPLAEGGDCLAVYLMAKSAALGNGSVQNPEKAKELFARAVSAAEEIANGDEFYGLSRFVLTDCYANALGVEADMSRALEAAREAAGSGRLPALQMFELAAIVCSAAEDSRDAADSKLQELGIEMDSFKARLEDMKKNEELYKNDIAEYEKILVNLELCKGQLALADELSTEARSGVEALAEEGNILAVKLMGDYYFGALGSAEPDYEKALDYYMQAADEDHAPAQAQLGLMYQEGFGVEVSYEQAMEWNNRAAQQGNAQGQAQIGYLYHMGLGVTQNLNEAGRWYSRAADQGDRWAAAKLAETEITNPQLAFEFHA